MGMCAHVGSAFVHRSPLRSLSTPSFFHRKNPRRGGTTLNMYFDDPSREKYVIRWLPENGEMDILPEDPFNEDSSLPTSAGAEKMDAIKRLLLGYNAESAQELSEDEIIEQMNLWAEKSGVVGNYFGDELYESVIGMAVCRSTTLVGCMAQFWKSVVDVIHEHSDEFNPVDRWTIKKTDGSQLFMMTFPDCQNLYDYKMMSTLLSSVEFSKEQCLHLGKRFTLTLFHPKYKNSPNMMSPERHSPFPTSGLHFKGDEDDEIERMLERTKPRKGYVTNDRNANPNDDSIPNLKDRRVHLEIMFNSAAASSPNDTLTPPSPVSRNMSQRFPKDVVVDMSQLWMDANRFTPNSRDVNKALQFADTLDDRWVISDSKVGEEVYYEMWSTISDLYDMGVDADNTPMDETLEAGGASRKKFNQRKFNHMEWMQSLSQPTPTREESSKPVEVISTMFVTTKFCRFNAQMFKRFAITVNAALRRLTGGKMFIEVFHPEYVGNNGYNSELRRSPFPMIQICYDVQRKHPSRMESAKIESDQKDN